MNHCFSCKFISITCYIHSGCRLDGQHDKNECGTRRILVPHSPTTKIVVALI